ncbi:MAG: DUF1501 domain-containing protein [Betaproteobacteria bacterium]|nr:DUF1501 domain-containing protein [Betaproteobacteria bacterium]
MLEKVTGRVLQTKISEDSDREFTITLGPPPDLVWFRASGKPPHLGQLVSVVGEPKTREDIASGDTKGSITELAPKSWHTALGVFTNQPIETDEEILATTRLDEAVGVLDHPLGRLVVPYLEGFVDPELRRPYESLAAAEGGIRELYQATRSQGSFAESAYCAVGSAFCFKQSFAASINLTELLGLSLDTHSSHAGNHLRDQARAWSSLARLFQIFKKLPYAQGSLFDHTTFVVFSEFGRLPYLNAFSGKDHNTSSNSALLAGKRVRGNQVVGGTHLQADPLSKDAPPQLIGLDYDFKAGRTSSLSAVGTSRITAENMAKTIHSLFNADQPHAALPRSIESAEPLVALLGG